MKINKHPFTLWSLFALVSVAACLFSPSGLQASGWKAGMAREVITPGESVWMAGYAARDKPSQGKVHDLYAKALALEDSSGNRLVIVTLDLIAVSRELAAAVSEKCRKEFDLERESLLMNASHTHCGPEIRPSKIPFFGIPEEYAKKIEPTMKGISARCVAAIRGAIEDLKPCRLSLSTGKADFAVSRRHPADLGVLYKPYMGGPRDNVVPVVCISDQEGRVRGILFGYACHPTTLNILQFCGDYPGFACRYLEEYYPGATAFFLQGAAGQLVPHARYQMEYAWGHGRQLAETVKNAIGGESEEIAPQLKKAFEEVRLDFAPPPSREALEKNLESGNAAAKRKARFLLDRMDRNEEIIASHPCPLQVLSLGKELLLVAIGGEVVVEYALKIKEENPSSFVWVAGYSNDVFGYLPTLQILREGGYEGGDALLYTPFPGPFAETVEDRVLEEVRSLIGRIAKQP
jgi:hypothetical protein